MDKLLIYCKRAMQCLVAGLLFIGPGLWAQSTNIASLINVNFGEGTVNYKVGFAATGISAIDFWNFYSRDTNNGIVANLRYSDNTLSGGRMTVANAPGSYGNGTSDYMYQSYLYPGNGGNITVTMSNLVSGNYDIYVYGHAPANEGNSTYDLSVAGTNYGSKTTTSGPGWNSLVWQDGVQYVVFSGVQITTPSQVTTLLVKPAASTYAILAGMQIVRSGTNSAPTSPIIYAQPADKTVIAGNSATFSVGANGTYPLSFQWLHSGTNLAGATSASLMISNAQAIDAGLYSVVVSNDYGSITSSNSVLTVTPAPPAPVTLINIDFDAGDHTPEQGFAATGQTSLDHWNLYSRDDVAGGYKTLGSLNQMRYADGSASMSGLTITNAPGQWGNGVLWDLMYQSYLYPFNGGNITVEVTNLDAGEYEIYVYGHAPSTDGNSGFDLSVSATSYGSKTNAGPGWNALTWQEDVQYVVFRNVQIGGGSDTLKLVVKPAASSYAILAGMQIARVSGIVTPQPPNVVMQPAGKTVFTGAIVDFDVGTTGTAPLSYQWRFNGNDIPGANSSSLMITNTQTADGGLYSVLVSNSVGTTISSNALLTVNAPPPPPQTPVTLIDVDFGEGTIEPEQGFAATGQTTSDLWNLYSRDDGHGGYLTFGVLSNLRYADGTVSTSGLTITNAPGSWGNGVVADQMYHSYLYPFNGSNITVLVTNLEVGTYEILVYGHAPSEDGNSGFDLSVNGTSYGSLTNAGPGWNTAAWQEGAQYVLFRDVQIASSNDVMRLVVKPAASRYAVLAGMQISRVSGEVTPVAPSIVMQPADQVVLAGGVTKFSVGASGSAPLSYQWRHGGIDLAGATTSSLMISNCQAADEGVYSVVVTNAIGSVVSSNASLTVIMPPPAPLRLIDIDFSAGSTSPKSGLAATGKSLTDYWNLYSRDDGHGSYRFFGAVTQLKWDDGTLSLAGITVTNAPGQWGNGTPDYMYQSYLYPFNGGNIFVSITNLEAGTYDIYLYGHAPANDGNSGFDLSVGGLSYGSKTNSGPGWNSVVWQEGVQYVVFHNVQITGSADVLRLLVKPALSSYAVLAGMQIAQVSGTVTPVAPSIVMQPADQSVTAGSMASFSVAAAGSAPLTYQWKHDGASITGATASSLIISNAQASDAGAYSVTVSNSVGSVASSNAELVVNEFVSAPSRLINIDFGTGTNSLKTGYAATGQASGDYWNLYSRDDGDNGYLTLGSRTYLKYADGGASLAGLTVSNAPGAWGNGTSDPMYQTYLYPLEGSNIVVTVTNLTVGEYDIYLYGHAGANDGNSVFELTVGETNYGTKATSGPGWNSVLWQEGVQYVVFKNVSVDASNETLTVNVSAGASGYALIAGMQIAQTSPIGQETAPMILTQPASQIFMVGSTLGLTVEANGTAPLTYQWRRNGTNLVGATSSNLVIPNAQQSDGGGYSVAVSNSMGYAISSNAIVWYYVPPPPAPGSTNKVTRLVVAPVHVPSVTTMPAHGITSSSATLSASIHPNGVEGGAWFEWGTTTNLGQTTFVQSVSAGSDTILLSMQLDGLNGGTTYFYRARANNSFGIGIGEILSFVHSPAPPRIVACVPMTTGQVHLDIEGSSGQAYMVQASSNLIDWVTVGAATEKDDGSYSYDDTVAINSPVRFYRVLSP